MVQISQNLQISDAKWVRSPSAAILAKSTFFRPKIQKRSNRPRRLQNTIRLSIHSVAVRLHLSHAYTIGIFAGKIENTKIAHVQHMYLWSTQCRLCRICKLYNMHIHCTCTYMYTCRYIHVCDFGTESRELKIPQGAITTRPNRREFFSAHAQLL